MGFKEITPCTSSVYSCYIILSVYHLDISLPLESTRVQSPTSQWRSSPRPRPGGGPGDPLIGGIAPFNQHLMVKNRVCPGPECNHETVLNEMDVKYHKYAEDHAMLAFNYFRKVFCQFSEKDNFTLNKKKISQKSTTLVLRQSSILGTEAEQHVYELDSTINKL